MTVYLDVTETYWLGNRTGIQRVCINFLNAGRNDFSPVALTPTIKGWRYKKLGENDLSWDLGKTKSKKFGLTIRRKINLLPSLYFLIRRLEIILRNLAKKDFWLASERGSVENLSSKDVIFCPDSFWSSGIDMASAWRKAQKTGARVVVLVHDLIPITDKEYVQKTNRLSFVRQFNRIIEIVDAFVCPSEFVLGQMREFGVEQQSSVIHFPGLNFGESCPPEPNYKTDGLEILFVGTMEARKGILNFCRVISKLADIEFRIHVVGGEPHSSVSVSKELRMVQSIDSRVVIHGNVSDAELANLEYKANFGLCPSFVEGFDIPFTRFLELGKPVLASNIDPHIERIREGVILFDPKSEQEIVEALQEAFNYHSKRNQKKPSVVKSWKDTVEQVMGILNGN